LDFSTEFNKKRCMRAYEQATAYIEQDIKQVILAHSWTHQIPRAAIQGAHGARIASIEDVVRGIVELSNLVAPAPLIVFVQLHNTNVELFDVFFRPKLLPSFFIPRDYETSIVEDAFQRINEQLRENSQSNSRYVFIDPNEAFCTDH